MEKAMKKVILSIDILSDLSKLKQQLYSEVFNVEKTVLEARDLITV